MLNGQHTLQFQILSPPPPCLLIFGFFITPSSLFLFRSPPPPFPRLLVLQILYCRYFDISEIVKAGLSLVYFLCTKRLFSWRKFLIMDNIKNTPQIKSETVIQRCSINKVFLDISQNSQENAFARVSFLIKLQPSDLRIY